MVSLDLLVVINALPAIGHDFGASLGTLQWTVSAYVLAYAASITTAAALGDRYGRRLLFVIGMVVFALASAACTLAPSATALIAARVVQGVGAGIIMPISLTILTTTAPPEMRGTMVGLWGGIAGLAVASGALVGGALTQGLSWHWIFWVNVPIGLIGALLASAKLVESKGAPTRLDLVAVALVSGGAVGIVLGLVRASDLGWGSAETLVSLVVGVVLTVGFILWERRVSEPMLPLRLFRSVVFASANSAGFFMTASLTASVFLTAQFFQLGLGYSPVETGLRLIPWTASALVVAPPAGALSDRVGRRPVAVLGLVLATLGLGWYATVAGPGTAYFPSILGLTLAGIGIAMALPVIPTAALGAVAMQDIGKASGVNSTLQRFGSAFGVAVATSVFASLGGLGNTALITSGYRPAMAACALMALVGALAALGLGKPRKLAAMPAGQAATKSASAHAPAAARERLG
jgi:EmrB/QacA subfamily drug resistance transporter